MAIITFSFFFKTIASILEITYMIDLSYSFSRTMNWCIEMAQKITLHYFKIFDTGIAKED